MFQLILILILIYKIVLEDGEDNEDTGDGYTFHVVKIL